MSLKNSHCEERSDVAISIARVRLRRKIAASAFGLLAMTPTNSILTDYYR